MHIKFLAHGTGDPRKASAYVIADEDHKGIARAGVSVLRGNPDLVADVAESLTFVHRYSSGVISWHKDDAPTPEQIEETLNLFEQVAFAGMDPERYCWTAVQHIEPDGSIHLHVLVARVDLLTGKALNIAPPGWKRDFDPMRDLLNHRHEWARPDDPARARLIQPGHEALKTAAAIRAGLTTSSAKEEITAWLTERIKAGSVKDRSGIVASLAEIGEITRQGKDYVSVKPIGFEKAVRLKGAIYVEDFNREQLVGIADSEDRGRPGTGQGIDFAAVAEARRDLEAAIRRRTEYNKGRYRRTPYPTAPGVESSPAAAGGDEQRTGGIDTPTDETPVLDRPSAVPDDFGHLPDSLLRQLGIPPEPAIDGDHNREERPAMAGNTTDAGSSLDDLPEPDASETVQTLGFLQQLKGAYDRTRTSTRQSIDGVISRIRKAFDRLGKTGSELEQQTRISESGTERLNNHNRILEQQARRAIESLADQTTSHPEDNPPPPSIDGPRPHWA